MTLPVSGPSERAVEAAIGASIDVMDVPSWRTLGLPSDMAEMVRTALRAAYQIDFPARQDSVGARPKGDKSDGGAKAAEASEPAVDVSRDAPASSADLERLIDQLDDASFELGFKNGSDGWGSEDNAERIARDAAKARLRAAWKERQP